MTKSYRLLEPAPPRVRDALDEHSELVQDLLFARGIASAEAARRFLEPHFERDSHDPFLLPDMGAAVERVARAVAGGELIAVWSDYDCDGIPGGVLLAEFLRDIGARVVHHIPDRHEDGFGLNDEGVRALAAQGASVIITVDCGTTDVAQAALAKALGIDLIITDHHLPLADAEGAMQLPPALVINAHRADSRYPFTELCGAGVAWKLVQALLAKDRFHYPPGREKWLLDLAGLATLADMVPLVGENRMLASYGLLVMRKNRRPGLSALLRLLRIDAASLTEDDLTFMVAPRINAASRLEKPQTAARLLAARDAAQAGELAASLNRINDERKGLVASAVKEARRRLHDRCGEKLIVVGSPEWRPGILGLVAQKLAEEFGAPAFVWGRGEAELLKGSCRSDGSVNVVTLMAGAKQVFADYGGHEFSGGFSLEEGKAHELAQALLLSFESLKKKNIGAKEILLDRRLYLAEAQRTLGDVQKLSPFGEGNRKPLFLFPGVSVAGSKMFGRAKDHLELSLVQDAARLAGVSFFSTPDSFQKKVSDGIRADIVGHVERDWRGRARVRVVDVL